MSVIVQQPDSLSFAGNLKKFVVTSAVAVALQLNKGAEQILNEIYQPGASNIVEIDLRAVIDKVLSVTLPGTALITEQSSGVADFTATIDGTAVAFRVIKGGVLELGSMAADFVNEHFLSWQMQDKQILQHQPEWLTVYANAGRNLKAKAYYQDNTNASMLLTALAAGKLLAVDVSWASINALFVKKNPIAWDVWFEDLAGTRLSYVQRYCLRNSDNEEKIFIWANTLGGIDSISLTGSAEDDKKLEHLIAEMGDESLQEYQTDKKREIKQSTGFLSVDESRWIEDFFYSGRRYLVGEDGAVRSIVLASSKIVGSTADDLFDYEFNYRLASESQLLNLERSFDSLPALEVPVDFFLTELLSGLPVAQYSDGLLMAVQSPFAQAWQKLSMAQLWGSALPGLVDGTTISVVNGKLQVNGVSGGVGVSKWGDLTEKPFSTLSNLFSVSPEGVLTLANTYALIHTHPYLSDADARIANWNSAFTWGNHATAGYAAAHAHPYRPDTWVPSWAEVSAKPIWTEKFGWDGTAVTVAGDLHVTGKIISDGSMQFYGISSGGTGGGGGASALWQLSDVADEMEFSINGDIPLYNGTHFARYNISNLSLYGHLHSIAQVTGLQGVLDGKQPLLGYTPYYASNFVAGVNYSAPHSHPYLSDVDARIANWSTAFGWGNHAGLYRPIGYVPSWGEITSKPTWTEKFGWDGVAVTLSTDMHITGKLVVDGTIQFFGAGAGGTGGGGSTTLWGLSDVSDDVANAVYGDLIMYNGTHFARINQSVLAPAVHYHTIAQVTGLQGALDAKMAIHTHPYLSNSGGVITSATSSYGQIQLVATSGLESSIGFRVSGDDNNQSWVIGKGIAQTIDTDFGFYYGGIIARLSIGGVLTVTGGNSTNWNTAYTHSQSAHYTGSDIGSWAKVATVPTWNQSTTGNAATTSQREYSYLTVGGSNVVTTTDSRLTNSRVASDVYPWAKASVKPAYTPSEVGALPNRTFGTIANSNTGDYILNQYVAAQYANIWINGYFQVNNSSPVLATFKGIGIYSEIHVENDAGSVTVLGAIGSTYVNEAWANSAYLYNTTQDHLWIKNGKATGDFAIFTGGTELVNRRLYISSDGDIGINTVATAGYKLNVNGTGYFSSSVTAYGISYFNAVNGVESLNTSGIRGASNTCQQVNLFNRLSVGYSNGWNLFPDAPSGGIRAAGNIISDANIIALGTIQFYTASDRRLKTDFETIMNPIEKIKSLTGYFFNYTDQAMKLGGYTSRRDIGLIAQDVHSILPEATGKLWNSDFMGYKADKLIPLLVEALKQQQTEIDQLKRQIAA